ncbi:HIRAN domain-containing protein [Natroniella sp. ANB-PHB2]|uniref:HIRAN domain-containing protein n=1 Tax=Natroniella sp. ANB-PHB2 TaxID=3384444 RepID=UPI0038D424FB
MKNVLFSIGGLLFLVALVSIFIFGLGTAFVLFIISSILIYIGEEDKETQKEQKKTQKPKVNVAVETSYNGEPLKNEYNTKVTGVTYENEDGTNRQEILKKCSEGESLKLEHHSSPYDLHAVKIMRSTGEQLGWATKNIAQKIAPYLNGGSELKAKIKNITGGGDKTLGCNIVVEKPTANHNLNNDYLPTQMYKKAEELRKNGEVEKAEEKYLKAIETDEFADQRKGYDPDSRFYEQLSKMYYHTNRDQKAIETLNRFLDIKEDEYIKKLRERFKSGDFQRLKNKYK